MEPKPIEIYDESTTHHESSVTETSDDFSLSLEKSPKPPSEKQRRVNEYVVRFRGSVNIPHGLPVDSQIDFTGRGSCTDVTERSNQDGTVNIIHSIGVELLEVLLNGEHVIGKKRGTQSQRMRFEIINWAQNNLFVEDDEHEYQKMMKKLIEELPKILPLLVKKYPNEFRKSHG